MSTDSLLKVRQCNVSASSQSCPNLVVLFCFVLFCCCGCFVAVVVCLGCCLVLGASVATFVFVVGGGWLPAERFELEESERRLREFELRQMRIAEAESHAAWQAEIDRIEAQKPILLDLARRCAAVVRMKHKAREEQQSLEAKERRAMAAEDLYSALREETEELAAQKEADMLKFAFEPFVPCFGDTGELRGVGSRCAECRVLWGGSVRGDGGACECCTGLSRGVRLLVCFVGLS